MPAMSIRAIVSNLVGRAGRLMKTCFPVVPAGARLPADDWKRAGWYGYAGLGEGATGVRVTGTEWRVAVADHPSLVP